MNEKNTVIFALSTCPSCKKVKELLTTHNIEFILAELDTLDIESRDKLLLEVKKYNPRETFPTIVVDGGRVVIVGYNEDAIKKEYEIK
ncbi:glutaredoxin family protein [Candidatus Magnetominusculus xianensis]|uniref:NrdH-redoxin n=1 Tax=Candidatus Magnetominusculus xianensis TaxID=1748249 RepID=A0ABR5SDG4_9BACT|nr:glutaredoxin [Candidatus Magnetominusculus xianensis]KWT79631.1 NrdH-redoxin [Candidatus Magnetominusculus xianensis]MBF0403845.1 glutaredoxin [Nitrospirota bacterium]